MTEDQHSEKRQQIRHPLTGDLTGSIISAKTGSLIPCIAVDVSKNGLRIVLHLDLCVGTELKLKLEHLETTLHVVWCKKEETKKGYFACGLKAADEGVDLAHAFLHKRGAT
jgi:hypothetical protein